MKSIVKDLDSVDDHSILDHVLVTFMQLSRSIKSNIAKQDMVTNVDFEIKDNFAPAQKNERQLVFKKTTGSTGRRKNNVLKYVHFCMSACSLGQES